MNKFWKRIIPILLILGLLLSVYQTLMATEVQLDTMVDFAARENGESLVSWKEDKKTVVAVVDDKGTVKGSYHFKTLNEDISYQIVDLASGDKYIYVLRDCLDAKTGDVKGQELLVFQNKNTFLKLLQNFDITDEEGYHVGWLTASGDTITLIDTDKYEANARRRSYEFGTVLNDSLTLKNTRIYPLKAGEGVYKAIGCGTGLAYISDSGKVYYSTEEGEAKEIYPARNITSLMYASFISYAESGYIYIGEYESGDILKLDVTSGDESVVLPGTGTFTGSSVFTPKDALVMDLKNPVTFTCMVKDAKTEHFTLLNSDAGVISTFDNVKYGVKYCAIMIIERLGIYLACLLGVILLMYIFISGIRGGHTIMERLISATVPLMFVAMALFGFISYRYYSDAIDDNFIKQVEDEGNMMAALFGQEAFNGIEYPYDYSGDDYSYVLQQMKTRDLYMRVVFYEKGDLKLVVDENQPCYYPYEILLNEKGEALYTKAALTGESVTGTLVDTVGERLVCITPIGGPSGDVVYLLESGVFTKNVKDYNAGYIRNFAVVTVSFLIIMLVVLMILFYQILSPIGEMRRQMQQFADGDRSVRIPVESEDELTGIAQVFNKMADDIDVQILNLEKLKDTYYRFVPPSIIGLLGKDNLAALKLGSNVKGEYALMNVRITPPEGMSITKTEELMNRFFNVVNRYTEHEDVITIVDDANLQSIMMIFQNGAESAIVTALTILATIDSENQLHNKDEQMDVRFVIDKSFVYFGICGDEERYIPVVMAPAFEELLENRTLINVLGSRLFITENAKKDNDALANYENRYVGKVEVDEQELGIYDIFYDRPVEELRSFKQTRMAFEKAMDLYEKGYYYEAKNMFAMVLRENHLDMAARYYVFKCESLQK